MSDNIKLPLVTPSDHPESRVMQWSALELAEINRLMREAVRLNATVPCCTNYAAGTTCFTDPKEDCPMLSAAPAAQPLVDEKDALLRQALKALEDFVCIIKDSQGVKGYHLNGDIAEWDEFDEVDAASNTVEAIRNHLGSRMAGISNAQEQSDVTNVKPSDNISHCN